ncbi:hypothetical protein DERP_008079 [Dermatophagoides pteronyssinus]|uniref:Uncharacterized protein n=1 Tax=Dermatophagoides pteronyssinus TaxID=6956 RepID=A0ABQ8JKG3_DERPT|nr:hypothetical protein DERP_008079 [Dermatophagoides pteronyssinus]
MFVVSSDPTSCTHRSKQVGFVKVKEKTSPLFLIDYTAVVVLPVCLLFRRVTYQSNLIAFDLVVVRMIQLH